MRRLLSLRVFRFASVGVVNAIISFSLLNVIYYDLHQSKILSSIIATGVALIFSFAMNRNFVFLDKSKRAREQAPVFVIVTVLGSFVVLNIVYIVTLRLMNNHEQPLLDVVRSLSGVRLSSSFVDINLSTMVGAVVAMIWNYNGYKYFVFKGSHAHVPEKLSSEV